VIAAANYSATSPVDGRASVTVAPNSTASRNLYFGFHFTGNPWHNLLNPLNANGIGGITAFDALVVINYLNLHPVIAPLVAGEAVPGQYLDVNNDNRCTAFDALQIINYLNLNGADSGGEAVPGSGGEAGEDPGGAARRNNGNSGANSGSGAESAPEGVAPARDAEEYFARYPIHLRVIHDPRFSCGCGACMAAAEDQ